MVPIVSVCIPSYNHARFVRECIESVLRQSCQDFEIVITDDASTDGSIEVIGKFRDPRIALQRHPRTLGPSAAINSSVRRARGKYVAILGSDDLFLPGKLEQQIALLDQQREICAAFCLVQGINEAGEKVPDDSFPLPAVFQQPNRTRAEWLRRFFLQGNCLCASTAFIRRDVMTRVGDHDPRLLQLQDFDYWVRICLIGEIHVVQRALAAYRIRTNSQNLSGDRPEANARAQWEAHKVLRRFVSIDDRRLLLEMFPRLQAANTDDLPLAYLLGNEALASPHPGVRLFGLDVLFDVLGNETYEAKLQSHQISAEKLFTLVAELDPLNLQRIAELKAEIATLERVLGRGGWTIGEWTLRTATKIVAAARRWRRSRVRR